MGKAAENAFHAMQGATGIDTETAPGELGKLQNQLQAMWEEIGRLQGNTEQVRQRQFETRLCQLQTLRGLERVFS